VRGGRLSVSLVKPIFAGNTVAVRARLTSAEAADAGWRYRFDVWCETKMGEKVLVGEANALAAGAAGSEPEPA
jgi:acyl dehydratase